LAIPTDPLFGQQLWLRNTNAGQFDLNVIDVWDDYTGEGVQVTVIDSGYDLNHNDIDGNLLTNIDWDYTNGDNNPDANGGNHGQAVIGIIAAEEGNNYGGVGVAWDSKVDAGNDRGGEFLRLQHLRRCAPVRWLGDQLFFPGRQSSGLCLWR